MTQEEIDAEADALLQRRAENPIEFSTAVSLLFNFVLVLARVQSVC